MIRFHMDTVLWRVYDFVIGLEALFIIFTAISFIDKPF